jgi:hypothetical protein
MLIKILALLAALIPLIILIIKRRPKSAEDTLPETPVIDSIKAEADAAAEQKFGPRK